MKAASALPDVEQTLALARDQSERDIARYRLWLAVGVTTISIVVQLLRAVTGSPWSGLNPTIRSGFVLYALGARALVHRLGARDWIIYLTLVIDCVLGVGNVVVTRLVGSHAASLSSGFLPYMASGWMVVIAMLNSLRNHRGANVVAFVAGGVTLFAVLIPAEGLRLVHVGALANLALATGVSFAATRQAHRQLELFARLQQLRRFLPAAAVSRVLADLPANATAVGGELQTVTVMATDLRGFTRMSERLEPHEVLRQLNAYHATMLEQIELHGGSLDKFIGDGALAVFGVKAFGKPPDPDSGAAGAVRCAAAMLVALEQLNSARKASGLPPLEMGIGVHTGQVLVGNIGVPERRLEFTVIGDTVNTASRLESFSKEAGVPVIVSAVTATLLKDVSALRPLPPAQLRGRQAPLDVFALVN